MINSQDQRADPFYYNFGCGLDFTSLKRVYFDLTKAQLSDDDDDDEKESTNQIHHAICLLPALYQSIARDGHANCLVVNSLAHVSKFTPKEQQHYTLKICDRKIEQGDISYRSRGVCHPYTKLARCDGACILWESESSQKELGWTRKMVRAKCYGTVYRAKGTHILRSKDPSGVTTDVDISNLAYLSFDRFFRVYTARTI